MDVIQLYLDHNIQFATEGHKHCRPGWVNVSCPFCTGNPGLHLGFDLSQEYFVCWRCGGHSMISSISRLLNINEITTKTLIKQYGGKAKRKTKEPKITIRRKSHKLPSGIISLTNKHKRYLEHRGFDPLHLEKEWDLMSTGPISHLDHIDYKHRIVAPIYWDDKRVSFQTRLARKTTKQEKKYLACPQVRELINHKHVLYGKQNAWKETGICVEGITDVWRFGINSFATFGIKFTLIQLRIIANSFKRVIVIFDNDTQAQTQASLLINELQFRGVDAMNVKIPEDPGEMKQEEADYLIKNLIK